ncbi:MAG TPA: glycosyltransferase [Sphingobacteriaceae bacterium]
MALTNKTIFILGAAKFDSRIASTSLTVARHLAKNNRVYYIDYPFTWKDCIKLRNTRQYEVRKPYFRRSSSGIIPTDIPNLKVVLVPPLPSINFLPEGRVYRFLLSRVQRKIRNRIRQIIRHECITDFIYINSFNFHYPDIADGLSPLKTVYHCVDPLVVPYDRRHGLISEDRLVRFSDLVICTSKRLCEKHARLNRNCFFVPNAADISHSSTALDHRLNVHPALNLIPKPVIGYFGNIERRIDFELLHEVVLANSDNSFVLAGPFNPEILPEWLFKTPNVHLTGSIPYNEMPALVKGFDVALIPFKKDEYSGTIFPLKLFEYLGAGKPVVATDFNPDLADFTGDTVDYCNSPDAFTNAIVTALSHDSAQKVAARVAVAQANTWDRRAADFEKILAGNPPVIQVS